MTVIPWPYRLLAIAALGAALLGLGWLKGAEHVQAQWDAAVQKQALQEARLREQQAQATVKVVLSTSTASVSSAKRATPSSRRFLSMSPLKLTLLALSTVALCACTTLPPQASCPSPPEILMRPPQAFSGLALSTVAGAVAANYQTCHETAEQLRALQVWLGEITGGTK